MECYHFHPGVPLPQELDKLLQDLADCPGGPRAPATHQQVDNLIGECERLKAALHWCAEQSKGDEGVIPGVVEAVLNGKTLEEALKEELCDS